MSNLVFGTSLRSCLQRRDRSPASARTTPPRSACCNRAGTFRTGSAWRDVPERYGSWATLHTRFRRWAKDGTFERMLRAAQARTDAAGDIEWLVSVDSTIVRAHQHAAGARKGGSAPRDSAGPEVA
jgi:transposase